MKKIFTILTLTIFSQASIAENIQGQPVNPEEAMPAATTASDNQAQATANVQEQSGFSRGSVVRSAFTTGIDNREPTEDLQNLTNENGKVMFFTELRDMSGQTALHRWEYDGKVVAEVEFNVRGPRWRVWSSKNLQPQWTGEWKVSVINGAGETISEKNLNINMAEAKPATASEPAASTEAESAAQ